MTAAPVPLIRRFQAIPEAYQTHDLALEDVYLGAFEGALRNWRDLEAEHRAVVLADAGAGKTFEFRSQAQRLRDAGKAAFFIRIEDIDAGFVDAFEVGDAAAFEAWMSSDAEAWFFLDSVDEVRLEAPRAFEAAIETFAARIQPARHRAHIYVSSRPYAWRSQRDREVILRHLPFALPEAAPDEAEAVPADPAFWDEKDSGGDTSGDTTPSGAVLGLYRLAPLSNDDIRCFAGHRGLADADAFLQAVERARLDEYARRPFDLEDLLATWSRTTPLDDRLAVLQASLAHHLQPPIRGMSRPRLSLERARAGARRLALAVVLTGQSNILLPAATAEAGLRSEEVLPDWEPADLRALLSLGVFNDPIYQAVRFRHREVRELLAAEALKDILDAGRRSDVEALIFRVQYGEAVIAPRMRPLLPWMLLFDADIRDRALAMHPEIATEGGDARQLPLVIRQRFLADIVERITDPETQGTGGDNAAIARIAQADLEDDVLALLSRHFANDDAIFFLGRLIWQGRMWRAAAVLEPIALDSARGPYARIVSVRAIASAGQAERRGLWDRLNSLPDPLPRRLLTELLADAAPDQESVERLLASLAIIAPKQSYEASGLTQALHAFLERLPVNTARAPTQPLATLVAGLNRFLSRPPFIDHIADEVSEPSRWLMAPAAHAVERLVTGRAAEALGNDAVAIVLKSASVRSWNGSEEGRRKTRLSELVPRWTEMNDALFWRSVAQQRTRVKPGERLADDWPVTWIGHHWAFGADSFARTLDWIRSRPLEDDRLVALHRTFRTYATEKKPMPWMRRLKAAVAGDPVLEAALQTLRRPPPSPHTRRWRAMERKNNARQRDRERRQTQSRAEFVARVRADPDGVRNPKGVAPGRGTTWQYHLSNIAGGEERRTRRGSASDWRALIPEFGSDVAEAYRDAARALWRAYRPAVWSEGGSTQSIPFEVSFGLAGLGMEGEGGDAAWAALDATETRQALRYSFWELNGFPVWFEALFRAHPELALAAVWTELCWELENPALLEGAFSRGLHDVVYHAPWLFPALAPFVLDWLEGHEPLTPDALRYARAILLGGGVEAETIARLARARLLVPATGEDMRPLWLAYWIDTDPDAGFAALRATVAPLEAEAASELVQAVLVNLANGRGESGVGFLRFQTPEMLKALYVFAHEHVKARDDIERANRGVYSPTRRDNAQEARNDLFAILLAIPGEATHRVLTELSGEHPDAGFRPYMRARAHERARDDSDATDWTIEALHVLFDGTDPPEMRSV